MATIIESDLEWASIIRGCDAEKLFCSEMLIGQRCIVAVSRHRFEIQKNQRVYALHPSRRIVQPIDGCFDTITAQDELDVCLDSIRNQPSHRGGGLFIGRIGADSHRPAESPRCVKNISIEAAPIRCIRRNDSKLFSCDFQDGTELRVLVGIPTT
jgi:hypothetical protein